MSAVQFTSIDGKPLDLSTLGAKAILVVNTASKCGFTPQYEGLQAPYEAKKDEGFVIVGVPSNDFMGQEPGTNAEILEFCTGKYDVTFPMAGKVTGIRIPAVRNLPRMRNSPRIWAFPAKTGTCEILGEFRYQ